MVVSGEGADDVRSDDEHDDADDDDESVESLLMEDVGDLCEPRGVASASDRQLERKKDR